MAELAGLGLSVRVGTYDPRQTDLSAPVLSCTGVLSPECETGVSGAQPRLSDGPKRSRVAWLALEPSLWHRQRPVPTGPDHIPLELAATRLDSPLSDALGTAPTSDPVRYPALGRRLGVLLVRPLRRRRIGPARGGCRDGTPRGWRTAGDAPSITG